MFRQSRFSGGTADFGDWAFDNLDGRDAGDRKINGGDGNTYSFDESGQIGRYGWVEYTGMRDGDVMWVVTRWEKLRDQGHQKPKGLKDQDPSDGGYNFQFIPENAEWLAYKIMLLTQKVHNKEVAAYIVKNNSTGKRGILILPWIDNDDDESDISIGFNRLDGVIVDYEGNIYTPLVSIHTHTDRINASPPDKNNAKDLLDNFGVGSVILGDTFYSVIRPGVNNKRDGSTRNLLNANESLINKL